MAGDIKVAASKAAAADRRSVSSLMEKLLVEYLIAEGYLSSEEAEGDMAVTKPEKAR